MLGRGTCLDGVNELSYIGATTMSSFFKWFCNFVHTDMFPIFVRPPRTPEEIIAAMGPYMALGLNGAIASSDAVHIAWGMCPAEFTILHTGKEGYVQSLTSRV